MDGWKRTHNRDVASGKFAKNLDDQIANTDAKHVRKNTSRKKRNFAKTDALKKKLVFKKILSKMTSLF